METNATSLILKVLDGLSMRASVTAQNIANANSPGYKPLKVTFEEALQAAAPSGSIAIGAVEPKVSPAINDQGRSDMRLDLELETASATAGRYGTLVELLNRQLQLQAISLSGVR